MFARIDVAKLLGATLAAVHKRRQCGRTLLVRARDRCGLSSQLEQFVARNSRQ